MCSLYGMHSASTLPTPVTSNCGTPVSTSIGSNSPLRGNSSPPSASLIQRYSIGSNSPLRGNSSSPSASPTQDTKIQYPNWFHCYCYCSKQHTKWVTSCKIAMWYSITIVWCDIILCMHNRNEWIILYNQTVTIVTILSYIVGFT